MKMFLDGNGCRIRLNNRAEILIRDVYL